MIFLQIAGGREQKQMAFATLLGSETAAAAFLADVQEMAAMTNYTYACLLYTSRCV